MSSQQFATGLEERDWQAVPMGSLDGTAVWGEELLGTAAPMLDDWQTVTTLDRKLELYENEGGYGLRKLNQNPNPSCTLHSTDNAFQWHLAKHARPIPNMDAKAAWVELTGGRGGAAIPTAVSWSMSKGMPIADGGRIKALGWWDIPNVASLFSAIALGRTVLMGWMHPIGAHAQCGLIIPKPRVLRVRGTWGDQEMWKDISESALADGIKRFGAFALLDVEILESKGDVAA